MQIRHGAASSDERFHLDDSELALLQNACVKDPRIDLVQLRVVLAHADVAHHNGAVVDNEVRRPVGSTITTSA